MYHQPPVLPVLFESHLQLSKDDTALNAVMHCTLFVSFNLYRMMLLHSYQRPRQSPFKSKEPTYPQASVWCRGLCDCPGWTNLFPPCLGPLPQINLSSWKFPSTLLEDHSSNQMVGIRLQPTSRSPRWKPLPMCQQGVSRTCYGWPPVQITSGFEGHTSFRIESCKLKTF